VFCETVTKGATTVLKGEEERCSGEVCGSNKT